MSFFGKLFGGGSSKAKEGKSSTKKDKPFARMPKQKDPNSNRSNKFGPKKD